jgi:tetratricopeptide (TPR) repeat protein
VIVKRLGARILIITAVCVAQVTIAPSIRPGSDPPAPVTIDYPPEGSIFPPEFTAPAFIWRDSAGTARTWLIEVVFAGGGDAIRVPAPGERLRIGEIDPRCVAETNQPPTLTPQEAASWSWRPDGETWAAIKRRSSGAPATVTITGFRDQQYRQPVSRGRVTIQTSKDPVGAPIFYRDVPLMPSEPEKGVIKPLVPSALPLIAWRLRNVGEPRSRVLVQGLHTCANCHSFSRDGKTLGMDLDGPQSDKGMYAVASIRPVMSIRNRDVITWNPFPDRPMSQRIGFMSQVSPDGRYVVTTINSAIIGADREIQGSYYVANFKDYRFLQVFYPTRGILVYYNRATGKMQPLPGADDPRYVHTGATWSPDGKYLVFSRAEAREPYPEGRQMAERANDPRETPIQYDLYRIPFNDGKGGRAEPIAGASQNGMSNSFPKISPDGRWIVFVQCRNGQLMRPDSQLYIIPAGGGRARRMRCNTPLMNSWHSFSPNGRWLVFSSKSRSPYTQMFLTHLDEEGNDSPAILIENATAANRAVNIPEFVNVAPDGLMKIDIPAVEFYRLFDLAVELTDKGRHDAAIAEWNKALELNPGDAKANNNLGIALAAKGRFDEAIAHYRKAVEVSPGYAKAHNNLGVALAGKGSLDEAAAEFRKAAEADPEYADAHNNLGRALAEKGMREEALAHFRKAVEINPNYAEAHINLGRALAEMGNSEEAAAHFQKAVEASPENAEARNGLAVALVWKGQLDEAVAHWEKAIQINPRYVEARYNLGNLFYYMKKKAPEALAQWREVLRLEPENAIAMNQVAWALATSPEASVRNGAEAVRLAERAVELTAGQEPSMLSTLAAAYAEAGRFSDAVETARRASAIAGQQNNRNLAEALRAAVGLYETRTPMRDTQ